MTMFLIEVDNPEDIGKNEKSRYIVHNMRKHLATDVMDNYSIRVLRVHPATQDEVVGDLGFC